MCQPDYMYCLFALGTTGGWSTTMGQTEISQHLVWIAVICNMLCILSALQRMNPFFEEPQTFHVAPPACESFYSSGEISQHLLEGLANNFMHLLMVSRRCILITLVMP